MRKTHQKTNGQAEAQGVVLNQARGLLAGVDQDRLRQLHAEWRDDGRTKVDIERREFGIFQSHGKAITWAWRRLGLETEREHPLVAENRRLRALLKANAIEADPA